MQETMDGAGTMGGLGGGAILLALVYYECSKHGGSYRGFTVNFPHIRNPLRGLGDFLHRHRKLPGRVHETGHHAIHTERLRLEHAVKARDWGDGRGRPPSGKRRLAAFFAKLAQIMRGHWHWHA